MEVIYKKACGIDVHKSFIVAVICDSNSIEPKYLRKRFSTFNNSLIKWIADLFKLGIVRHSFIPTKDIRVLRELTRYLYKLTNMRSSGKNRFTNALTVGNCKLDMVFSDIFGKSSTAIINTILSQNTLAPGCNESAGKKKSVKISRAGVYLKPALVEVAHAAVTDKTNAYYANKYSVLSKRRGKKRAIIAIARKILVAIYHMLSTGEVFNPSDLASVETSDKDRVKYTKNNFLQSTKQLFSLGLTQDEIIQLISLQNFNLTPIT